MTPLFTVRLNTDLSIFAWTCQQVQHRISNFQSFVSWTIKVRSAPKLARHQDTHILISWLRLLLAITVNHSAYNLSKSSLEQSKANSSCLWIRTVLHNCGSLNKLSFLVWCLSLTVWCYYWNETRSPYLDFHLHPGTEAFQAPVLLPWLAIWASHDRVELLTHVLQTTVHGSTVGIWFWFSGPSLDLVLLLAIV